MGLGGVVGWGWVGLGGVGWVGWGWWGGVGVVGGRLIFPRPRWWRNGPPVVGSPYHTCDTPHPTPQPTHTPHPTPHTPRPTGCWMWGWKAAKTNPPSFWSGVVGVGVAGRPDGPLCCPMFGQCWRKPRKPQGWRLHVQDSLPYQCENILWVLCWGWFSAPLCMQMAQRP